MGRHELCAVEQGEPLLWLELDRTPAHIVESLWGRNNVAVPHHFAKAEQRKTEVGERCKVARRAERALTEHDRKYVGVIEINQTLHGGQLHTRVAIGKRLDFKQEHQTHYLRSHPFAKPAGMRHDEIFLKLRQCLAVDRYVAQRAKTGSDAVDRLGLRLHLLVKIFAALLDALLCVVR